MFIPQHCLMKCSAVALNRWKLCNSSDTVLVALFQYAFKKTLWSSGLGQWKEDNICQHIFIKYKINGLVSCFLVIAELASSLSQSETETLCLNVQVGLHKQNTTSHMFWWHVYIFYLPSVNTKNISMFKKPLWDLRWCINDALFCW